jgi:hypothetical protein
MLVVGSKGERRVRSNAEVEDRRGEMGLERDEEAEDVDARLEGRDGVCVDFGANDRLT